MRRYAIICLSVILCLLSLGYFLVPAYPVTITQQQINDGLADRLPMVVEHDGDTMEMLTGKVTFSDDKSVSTYWEFNVDVVGFDGTIGVLAKLNLQYENGAFYLRDVNYDDVQLAFLEEGGSPDEIAGADLGDLLVLGARRVIGAARGEAPDPTRTYDPVLTNAVKQVLTGILRRILNNFPVYDLRSAPGNIPLAALVLEDIVVSEGQATAVFSVQGMISKIAFGVLVIILLLALVGKNAPLRRGV